MTEHRDEAPAPRSEPARSRDQDRSVPGPSIPADSADTEGQTASPGEASSLIGLAATASSAAGPERSDVADGRGSGPAGGPAVGQDRTSSAPRPASPPDSWGSPRLLEQLTHLTSQRVVAAVRVSIAGSARISIASGWCLSGLVLLALVYRSPIIAAVGVPLLLISSRIALQVSRRGQPGRDAFGPAGGVLAATETTVYLAKIEGFGVPGDLLAGWPRDQVRLSIEADPGPQSRARRFDLELPTGETWSLELFPSRRPEQRLSALIQISPSRVTTKRPRSAQGSPSGLFGAVRRGPGWSGSVPDALLAGLAVTAAATGAWAWLSYVLGHSPWLATWLMGIAVGLAVRRFGPAGRISLGLAVSAAGLTMGGLIGGWLLVSVAEIAKYNSIDYLTALKHIGDTNGGWSEALPFHDAHLMSGFAIASLQAFLSARWRRRTDYMLPVGTVHQPNRGPSTG